MASIQGYLGDLEARLAPALDAQALQERLTEAENHLRDRAQEFEEVGLPPHEAEARAVAAFGAPEEYAEDAPVETKPHAVAPRIPAQAPPRDLALQLAWSMVGLGIVAMLTMVHATEIAAAVVVATFGLGALFGRPTPIGRMGLLAVASSAAAFLVMAGFYEPVPSSGYRAERFAVRPRGAKSDVEWTYQQAVRNRERFQHAREAYEHGRPLRTLPGYSYVQGRRGYVGPASRLPEDLWSVQGEDAYVYALGTDGLEEYETPLAAALAWKQNGDALQARFQEVVAKAKPLDPDLSEAAFTGRCALVALMGGVAFLASMVGAQALALLLRAFFARLFGGFRQRPAPSSRAYAESERS